MQEFSKQKDNEEFMRRSLSELRMSQALTNGRKLMEQKAETARKQLEDQELKVSLLLERLRTE
jgi:hypothetical protein